MTFNHIEDGHNYTNHPTPKCEMHKKVWAGGSWYAHFAYLDDKNKIKDKP